MKAIETIYNGYRFRSRLEARLAVFFDSLNVTEYEFEPEGFELKDGTRYLPDFRVKCYGNRGSYNWAEPYDLYIEVKGKMTAEDAHKILLFPEPIMVVDKIPRIRHPHDCVDSSVLKNYDSIYDYIDSDGIEDGICPFNYQFIDGDYFAAYPAAHDGKFYLMGDDSNYINRNDLGDVLRAYQAASMARFEFNR